MQDKKEFKIGDRVEHKVHGKGVIVETGDSTSFVVKFDNDTSWGNYAEVSTNMLEKIK